MRSWMCCTHPEHKRWARFILLPFIRRLRITPGSVTKNAKSCPYGIGVGSFSGAVVTMKMDKKIGEQIMNNRHDRLYFVNTNRTITYWNKGAERLSGFPVEGVVGKFCSDNMRILSTRRESLLKRADVLLYKSKAAGSSCMTMD